MQPSSSRKSLDSKFSLNRGLSIGLPVVLILAFLGKTFVNFDGIGWSSGFSHPLTGWDHLVTMLAVGIWAAQLRGQAVWMLPLAFVGVMSLGGLAGASGLAIPSIEGIILLSCAVFSILITRKVRFSTHVNVMIVAFFAFFHGFAHGQEISTSASLISYTLGFMLATLLLHGAGILVAKLVMLSVTCLMALSLSWLAQADDVETVSDIKIKNSALMQDSGFVKTSDFGIATERILGDSDSDLTMAYGQPCSKHCLSVAGKLALARQLDEHGITKAMAFTQPVSAEIRSDHHPQALSFKPANFQTLRRWFNLELFDLDYLSGSSVDFKHYFPDINHTPGKDFLTNGVGLASPPLWFSHVLTSQISAPLCNNPFPAIEDSTLQLSFAKSDVDNSLSVTISNFWQSIQDVLTSSDDSSSRICNQFSYLISIQSSSQPGGLAMRVMFHSVTPEKMLTAWPVTAFSLNKHNKKNPQNDLPDQQSTSI